MCLLGVPGMASDCPAAHLVPYDLLLALHRVTACPGVNLQSLGLQHLTWPQGDITWLSFRHNANEGA